MESSTLVLLCMLSFISILIGRHVLFGGRQRLPGPARIPILGNHFPTTVPIWEALRNYSKEFGPVYSLRILGIDIVVATTSGACRELTEARSSVFSGRRAPKMAELAGMYEGILFQPDPVRLRQGRKFLASGLQPTPLKAYQPVIHRNIVTFLQRVLTSPTNIYDTIPILATGVSLEITYGYHVSGLEDQFVQRARISVNRFVSATALSLKDGFLVSLLPFLAYIPSFLPGMSFKRTAEEWSRTAVVNAAEGFNMVTENMRNGSARPCLLQKALEAKDGTYEDIVLMRTAAQVYSGGSDTTSSALKTFVLAMTLYPEVQAKAQADIDRHMGGRLPSYAADHEDLPAILHDEAVFPDHEVFRPERWLDSTILQKHDVDPLDIVFGFGRRHVLFLP
ncbi:hypothetical protein EUX98_g8188 [Antrodiella citrinella]|uniref:Cytochrome P450 n=1 Tax=Antrodiella citrinella TaxID=2447956 RepID=A0A4S4MAN5_9APHY|nr:hypothetical protein EUX98_g8188 [Antrodiella citrinella]